MKRANTLVIRLEKVLEWLSSYRVAHSQAKSDLKKFRETNERYSMLERLRKHHSAKEAQATMLARLLAFKLYQETEDPEPVLGIAIKQAIGFEYEREELLPWIKKEMPALMQPDWKAFNAYLKNAKTLPPGVEQTVTPKAYISSDLSVYDPEIPF
jgi:hypothetical protein